MLRIILNILMFLVAIGIFIFLFKKYPDGVKLLLSAYLTMYIIYRLTTPQLKYKPWIVPDDITEGPPIQLYYPENPFGFVARTSKHPKEKKPEISP